MAVVLRSQQSEEVMLLCSRNINFCYSGNCVFTIRGDTEYLAVIEGISGMNVEIKLKT